MKHPSRSRRSVVRGGLAAGLALFVAACELPSPQSRRPARVPRVGVLTPGSPPTRPSLEGLRLGFRELGYVEGQSILLDVRWDEGRLDAWPGLIADLLTAPIDAIVAGTTPSVAPALRATSTIPIVAPTLSDPVGEGIVASLARPGGNLTGLTLLQPQLNAKRLELLLEALPGITHVTVLWLRSAPDPDLPRIEALAASRAVRVLTREIQGPDDLDGAFQAAADAGSQAVMLAIAAQFTTHQARVLALAARHRLPTMAGENAFAEAGGLMNYGPNVADNWRRGASYVDKILRGSLPGDLPIEQPATFDLAINLTTAQALGLTISPSVLQQATTIIR